MFNEDLRKEAITVKEEMNEAIAKYDKAFEKFMKSVVTLPIHDHNGKLWKFVALLTRNLKVYPVEAACQNTFCAWDRDDTINAISAVATLRRIKSELSSRLTNVITDKSDDSYGDFIDAFFLAGPNIVGEALDGEYDAGDQSLLKKKIDDSCGEKISKMIWDGENYLMSSLEERAKSWIKFIEPIEPIELFEEKLVESESWYEKY